MKCIKVGLRIWLVLALIIALGWAFAFTQHSGVNVFYDDEPVTGARAFALATGVGLVGVLVVTLVVAMVGLIVPLALILAAVAVVLALCVAGVAVGGVLVACMAPILIPVVLCALLVRSMVHRSRAAAARPPVHS